MSYIKKYHLQEQDIPDGHQIFADRLEVFGVRHRRRACIAFCKGREQSLSFRLAPRNRFDPNAIEIHGHWRGWLFRRSKLLGYVERDLAAKIAGLELGARIKPRLFKTYLGRGGYVEIGYQITGPKADADLWRPRKVRTPVAPPIPTSPRVIDGTDELVALIDRMLSTPPLSPDEIAAKQEARRVDFLNEAHSPTALRFLSAMSDKSELRATDNELRWQVKVVSDMFDDWLRLAEWPAPHYANRICVILRKAKALPFEEAFLEAYCSHFLSDAGRTDKIIADRFRKVRAQ